MSKFERLLPFYIRKENMGWVSESERKFSLYRSGRAKDGLTFFKSECISLWLIQKNRARKLDELIHFSAHEI
jgi:hypothetical protein